MRRGVASDTPLELFLKKLGLQPLHVVAEAKRVARLLGLRVAISRTHFGRIRLGKQRATEEKILLIVATLRSMTGLAVRASDLFMLEPALSGISTSTLMGHVDPFRGGTRRVSIFSRPRWSSSWGFFVEDERPSAAETLEALYREHAPILRSNARRRFNIIAVDDIEGLLNDVLMSFLERQPQVEDVRAFLIGAMNNACKHYLRKRQHETPLLPEHDDRPDSSTEEEIERWTLLLSLGATLARMGTKCRETLRRYYLHDEKPESIATRLDTTTAYIFQLLSTCRKRAREIYRELTEPRR
jgi:RNA polymerase sigma factor (sigma-70 family)